MQDQSSSVKQSRESKTWVAKSLALAAGVCLAATASLSHAVQLECKYSDFGRFTIDTATGVYTSSMMPAPYIHPLAVDVSPMEYVFMIPVVSVPPNASAQWDTKLTALIKISRSTGEFTQAYGKSTSEGVCAPMGAAKF